MKNKIPRKYANLIEDESISIKIVESRWDGKEVSVSDSRQNNFTNEELRNVRSFLNEYKDIILEVHEIKEQYDGVKQAWEIGRIAERVINEKEITNGDFALITQVGHSNDGTYIHQMRQVYNIFPNEEYSQEHFGKSSMCELTQTVDSTVVRKINNNALEYDIDVRTYRLRAIRDVYKSDTNKEAIKSALNRNLFKQFSDDKAVNIIYDAYLLLGESNVSRSEIERNVKDIRS